MAADARNSAALVVRGIPGFRVTKLIRKQLGRLGTGGVALFRHNFSDPVQLERLSHALSRILSPQTLIATDQEGGRVARFRAPFTEWPPMRRLGATRSPSLARAAGRAMGSELRAAGINLNFAPVLDVDSNPANPVIGDRSFGSEPGLVARMGLAFAEGLLDAGILPCGKHFPGHGDTALDSHLALPEVDRTQRQLDRVELLPFRRAIAAKFPMLMSAHVRYPALDPDLPATLSHKILTKLLRHEMGFRGVVVSDDLGMHALDGYGSISELAPRALAAGCDLILACQSLEDGEAAVAGLKRALDDGRLSERRVKQALGRVRRLHRWLERRRPQTETLEEVLRSGEGAKVVRAIERRLERLGRG